LLMNNRGVVHLRFSDRGLFPGGVMGVDAAQEPPVGLHRAPFMNQVDVAHRFFLCRACTRAVLAEFVNEVSRTPGVLCWWLVVIGPF